jgi:small subunit ribosomal protein S9
MEKTKTKKSDSKYFEAKGRRKTSVARVRLFSGRESSILVNDKKAGDYFPTKELQCIVGEPLKKVKIETKFKILAKIKGGGIHSQAEALRHGISRALIKFNSEFRKSLKKEGFLTRDSRMKERRKFGLKKARKAPQWSKR